MNWILGLIGFGTLVVLGVLFGRWLLHIVRSEHKNRLLTKSLDSQKKDLGKYSEELQVLKKRQSKIRVPVASLSWDDIKRLRSKGPINLKTLSQGVDKTVDKL